MMKVKLGERTIAKIKSDAKDEYKHKADVAFDFGILNRPAELVVCGLD
jgi:hypothetical protein